MHPLPAGGMSLRKQPSCPRSPSPAFVSNFDRFASALESPGSRSNSLMQQRPPAEATQFHSRFFAAIRPEAAQHGFEAFQLLGAETAQMVVQAFRQQVGNLGNELLTRLG